MQKKAGFSSFSFLVLSIMAVAVLVLLVTLTRAPSFSVGLTLIHDGDMTFPAAFHDHQHKGQGQHSISNKMSSAGEIDTPSFALVPGELPGYTGWPRPEETMAGYFAVVPADLGFENGDQAINVDSNATASQPLPPPPSSPSWPSLQVEAGQNWSVTVQCQGHVDCAADLENPSWFYVRAYGPAILTGIVQHSGAIPDAGTFAASTLTIDHARAGQLYTITFRPWLPGLYTVEVVLSFSRPTPMKLFPLKDSTKVLAHNNLYEGYILPDFPMTLQVLPGLQTTMNGIVSEIPKVAVCQTNEVLIHSATDGLHQGQWRIAQQIRRFKSREPASTSSWSYSSWGPSMSLGSYQHGVNSLGFISNYDTTLSSSPCQLMLRSLPASVISSIPKQHRYPYLYSCLSSTLQQKHARPTHFVMVGDSTMKLQYQELESWLATAGATKVRVSFFELWGGTIKCFRKPHSSCTNLREVAEQEPWDPNERRVVLFNTGLHEIDRLCGPIWASTRQTYLDETELAQPCMDLYPKALRMLADAVALIPAEQSIFQTTTAGWPKYGNWGASWEVARAQYLPEDLGFIEVFNELAVGLMRSEYPEVLLVDGYWVSLARPDNREVTHNSLLGNKLVHPGVEVVEAMVRLWSTVAHDIICGTPD